MKKTIIVAGRLAVNTARLGSARASRHGEQVMPIDAVAARLAGGFISGIDGDVLSRVVTEVVARSDDLADLGAVRDLPGLPTALVATLQKVWRAGLELDELAALHPEHPRLRTLARLEATVAQELPPNCLRPSDLVAQAIKRLRHAPAILGSIELRALADLAPCWRP